MIIRSNNVSFHHRGLDVRKLSSGFANNKGADQPTQHHLVQSDDCYSLIGKYLDLLVAKFQRISSDKASNLPKRDVRFILLK